MIFAATPYDITATFFYFETAEQFEEKSKNHRNEAGQPVEEYEIQYIDGDELETAILAMVSDHLNQANLEEVLTWVEDVKIWSDQAIAGLAYRLSNLGESLDDIMELSEDEAGETTRCQFDGYKSEERALEEYAMDFVEDTGILSDMPEALRNYFDYEAYGRDMALGGDVTVFEFMGDTYIMDNHV